MYKIGLINKSGNQTFVEKYIDSVITNDDDIVTIESSDIVFYFEDIKLLPNNTFDTKNLHNLVESWGYCFENEIPVHGKTFVIGCNVNKGEIQSIHEILNPMNIDIVYLPPTSDVLNGNIILGTLDPYVVSDLTSLFIKIGVKNLSITMMSSNSAEIANLLENNFCYLKHTFSKMIEELVEDKTELGLISKFLGLGTASETLDMKLKNDVLSSRIQYQGNPINFGEEISNNLQNHTIFTLNNILDDNQDLNTPILVDGITYFGSDTTVDSRKVYGVLELLKRGYTVHIFEDEKFLRDKKIISELSHDFGDKIKFYKKSSHLTGKLVSF
jgi:hypothetical protein